MALVRLRWWTAATWVALPLATSCNALWGVDKLSYDGPSATSTTTGGMPGGGGGAGGAAGGSTGGAGACSPVACSDCSSPDCTEDRCEDETALCKGNAECAGLASCMSDCAPLAAACQSDCIEGHPNAVAQFYQQFECTSCTSLPCTALCSGMCDGGCSSSFATCNECINSDCARTVCSGPHGACAQSPECDTLAECIVACDGDETCTSQCVQQHPDGLDLYNAALRCVLCTKPACWDVCAPEQPSCAGFAPP